MPNALAWRMWSVPLKIRFPIQQFYCSAPLAWSIQQILPQSHGLDLSIDLLTRLKL